MGFGSAEEDWTVWKERRVLMFGCSAETVCEVSLSYTLRSFDLVYRYKAGIPADLPITLIPQLKIYIASNDMSLLSQALSIVALLLQLAPAATFPEVEREILQDIYKTAHSPLISGAPFDSVLAFFAALVEADVQIAAHVVSNLVSAVEKADKSQASLSNVAKCVGQVVKSQHSIAAGAIASFAKHLKVNCPVNERSSRSSL